jgi:hypothetical protein
LWGDWIVCVLALSSDTLTSGRTDDRSPMLQAGAATVEYDGPIIAASGPGGPSAPWIWVANGTSPRMFSPPATRRPPPPLPPDGFSADRIIESFRAEALGLDETDPFLHELFDDEDREIEDVEIEEEAPEVAAFPKGAAIRILGPVETHGWRSPPERPVVVELACYLALHREHPVSGDSLRAALRPDGSKEQSAKTLRTYLSMVRRSLGSEALPSRPSAGYQLTRSVTTDWEQFLELSQSRDLNNDIEALALIRGRPFEGVPSGTYAWVFSEFLVSQIEVAIASVTTRVVSRLVNRGDHEQALEPMRQGLRAVSGDYGLWELYLSIAAQVSPNALNRARHEARAALGDDAPQD